MKHHQILFYNGSPLCFFLFNLQFIESFAIYSDNITLRYKGVFINIPHHSEYFIGLIFLGKYNNYFDALFAIPTGTIQ